MCYTITAEMPTQLTPSLPFHRGMYQLKRFGGPALLAYSVLLKYNPDPSEGLAAAQKFMYRQKTKNYTQEQSGSASANPTGSQQVYSGHMWLCPSIPSSLLVLVGDATHDKYRPIVMQVIFLLVPHVLFAVS